MNLQELAEKIMSLLFEQAKVLNEINLTQKIEPEQKRKNVATIISLLHEAMDYYQSMVDNANATTESSEQ